jgi:hypothetical protein
MFDNEKNTEGNFGCYLFNGASVCPEEQELERCKYTGENITEEYASKRFWMLPFEYFYSKIKQIENITNFAQKSLKGKVAIRQELMSILYSQLVTALEVCLREQFKIGMESPKAFNNFVKKHVWDSKYYPNEIHDSIKQLVDKEIEKINFQNFAELGSVYNAAFDVDIFSFPERLKREINRILQYRHSLIHQDEIWEKGHLVKIDLPQLQQDMKVVEDFIDKIDDDFGKSIGYPSEIKMIRLNLKSIKDERIIANCQQCPLGQKFDTNNIVCYEGAYDGIGFGMKRAEWKKPICGGISFKEAMRQRKILGEKALFGSMSLIPLGKKKNRQRQSHRLKSNTLKENPTDSKR